MNMDSKKQLRNHILLKRNALSVQEIQEAGQSVLGLLKNVPEFIAAKRVFCYVSFRSEVPTSSIIEYCLQQGKQVYIPVCVSETKEMVIAKLDHQTEMSASNYGLLEPSLSSIFIGDRESLDIALIPGAVFDQRGYRIGYGAGYYDKFFAQSSRNIYKAALAFSFQLVEEVPKDEHDVPVNCIITEYGIIQCKNEK